MRIIIFFIAFTNTVAFAQGIFVGKDHSSTMMQVSYVRNEDEAGVGAVIGHSFDGAADIGIVGGKISDVLFWGGAFSVYFANPDSSGGVVVSVDLSFTDYNPKYATTSVISLTAGGTAGVRIPIFQNFAVAPLMTGGIISTSNSKLTFYGGGVSLIVRGGRTAYFVVTPSFSSSDKVTTYGIEAGFVISD